jgi:hypothetical protein
MVGVERPSTLARKIEGDPLRLIVTAFVQSRRMERNRYHKIE